MKIRTCPFVPDQEGWFHSLIKSYRDIGVDEELKDIAMLLEKRIRLGLRDTRLTSLSQEVGAGDKNNESVIPEIIKKLRERASSNNPDSNFRDASVRLFSWIVNRNDYSRLLNFPVFADNGKSGKPIRNLPTECHTDS